MTRTVPATIHALDTIILAAMDNADCVSARHAFNLARKVARETAARTNNQVELAALRQIDLVAGMGLR